MRNKNIFLLLLVISVLAALSGASRAELINPRDDADLIEWMQDRMATVAPATHFHTIGDVLFLQQDLDDRPTRLEVQADLAGKVDTTTMTAAMAAKADQSAMTAALAAKADSATVTAALCPTAVFTDSRNFQAVDSTAVHTYGAASVTNSNRTVTVAVSKSSGLTVAALSLTLLGAPVAANGSVISATFMCN